MIDSLKQVLSDFDNFETDKDKKYEILLKNTKERIECYTSTDTVRYDFETSKKYLDKFIDMLERDGIYYEAFKNVGIFRAFITDNVKPIIEPRQIIVKSAFHVIRRDNEEISDMILSQLSEKFKLEAPHGIALYSVHIQSEHDRTFGNFKDVDMMWYRYKIYNSPVLPKKEYKNLKIL
jgi:hypothetical protein